ncbi:hypothetical protein KVR01_001907 [Diaporthe batatas]|uniref:uncharacterized protein n=1 Tax=Diaporthe batatas TaxID=748121 RepID=UPI001D056ACC|nr:uncharacterized protein KVR01_001907 [Diaporthe batatas]KAG8169158.1 hypothetical protein KVR01_001907 [Diaporthe batatas]
MSLHDFLSRAVSESNKGDHDLGVGTTIDTSDYAAAKRYAAAALLAVAIYNAFEMMPVIYFTFSKFSGLYFWSMVTAVTGVLVHSIGFVLNNFQLTGNQTLPTILTTSFWIPMVSGQSMVLYSRLYLINVDKRLRRYALIMIIVNGLVLHTATVVTTAGSNSQASHLFIKPYAIMERIQITVFSVQEFILSGLYVWKAWKFLSVYRSGGSKTQDKLRAMMLHLILSNIIVVSLDITVIVLEFLGLYYVQVAYKAFVYSVKLKCEVGILNKLVEFVKHTTAKRQRKAEDSFCLTSQIEREWEKTLRTTFGVAADDDDDEVGRHNQRNLHHHHHHHQQQQQQQQQVHQKVLEPIDEGRSRGSGSTRVDGASTDGGSRLIVAGSGASGLRESRGSLEGS